MNNPYYEVLGIVYFKEVSTMKKEEKVKNFVKKHDLELILLGVFIAGGIAGFKIRDRQYDKALEKIIKSYPVGTEYHF